MALVYAIRQVLRVRDPAVFYGFVWRLVQIGSVPITLSLVAARFDPTMQGFYYTFGSLVALRSFFELGLYLVVMNVAAHEWVHLSLDPGGRVIGAVEAQSRLASLIRQMFRYYVIAGTLFFAVVALVGLRFFSKSPDQSVDWILPWLGLVFASALTLVAEPFCALLEGCGQLEQVYRMRVVQATLAGPVSWLVILAHGGLWTTVVAAAVQVTCVFWLLLGRYRKFFASVCRTIPGPKLNWWRDMWPMQWRVGCSGVVNYFAFSLFNPVMFYYHGAGVAGQMGMSLQIIGGIQTLALIWLSVEAPQFGALIARREFVELDRRWNRTLALSLGTFVTGGLAFFAAEVFALQADLTIAQRVLPLLPLAGLLLAGGLMNASQSMAAYLRAHKQEPMFVMSVCTSLLIGALVWLLGRRTGADGAAWGYAAALCVGLIWQYHIWQRCRVAWHT